MLLDNLQQDLKQAMLDRDEVKTATLRLLISELKYAQIQKNSELSDSDILAVVQKEVKKRKEGAEGFRKGSREDAAQKEEAEAKVLESYMPAQISDEELTKIVEETITEVRGKNPVTEVRGDSLINNVGASSIQDMGGVIGKVREKVGTRADGARISQIVKEKLNG